MKQLILILLIMPLFAYAADVAKDAPPAPAAVIAKLPDEAPVVALPAVVQPPDWLTKTLELVSSLPYVGPVVVEIAKWLGVLASVLTILVTALLGILKALALVLPAVRLANLVEVVVALQNSKVMYWLKFFSVYNAVNEEKKTDLQQKPPAA